LTKTDLDLSWWKAAESPGKITAVLPKLVISVAATYMRRHEDSFAFLLAVRKMLDKAGGNLCRRFAWKQLEISVCSNGRSHLLITFPAQLKMVNLLDGELIRACG